VLGWYSAPSRRSHRLNLRETLRIEGRESLPPRLRRAAFTWPGFRSCPARPVTRHQLSLTTFYNSIYAMHTRSASRVYMHW
jgi:hypothetical protein